MNLSFSHGKLPKRNKQTNNTKTKNKKTKKLCNEEVKISGENQSAFDPI